MTNVRCTLHMHALTHNCQFMKSLDETQNMQKLLAHHHTVMINNRQRSLITHVDVIPRNLVTRIPYYQDKTCINTVTLPCLVFNSTSCVILSTISVGKSTGISAISTMYLRMIQLASSLRSSRLPSKCLKCSTSNQNTTHSTESSATQKFNNCKRQQILIYVCRHQLPTYKGTDAS